MQISSILRRLRCRLGWHGSVSLSVPVEEWPVHRGYMIRKCPDCGAREFNWRHL